MNIYLDKVDKDKKDTLYRLLQYSLYEESLNDGNEMNEDGIFIYKYFDAYFIEKDRYAFFIREKESNKLLGFVMINKYVQKSDNGHSIAEYMVITNLKMVYLNLKT